MKTIKIADRTLCSNSGSLSFKERLETARQLERLQVDYIEFPEISDVRTDTLLIRTVASFVKKSVISVAAGSSVESIDYAAAAVKGIKNARIRIELPVSPVCMEYTCHKKPQKMLEWIGTAVAAAVQCCDDVEFFADDATRAEKDFLEAAVKIAAENGACAVTLSDRAATLMPDEFAEFAAEFAADGKFETGVCCNNKNGLACAQAVMAVKKSVSVVKTAVCGEVLPLDTFAVMLKNCGNDQGISCGLKFTELGRIIRQINWITDSSEDKSRTVSVSAEEDNIPMLVAGDDKETVIKAAERLGYDLGDEDAERVYEEFKRVAEKKNIGSKELDAIIASTALQVPAAYTLDNYVVNNGNIIAASAQVSLKKDGKVLRGICVGDGPIDAAFLAIEQILGHRYELDDFQIQAVTEGKESMGSAIVKLRSGSKLYSGNGISTDIIGASIRAYIAAVNKIVYEEG